MQLDDRDEMCRQRCLGRHRLKGMTDCTDSPYTWPRTGDDHTIHPSYSVILAHPELIVWYRITSACIVYDSSL
jgi:hypothetical protein